MKDERPTHIDLFSGIGGFAIAAERCGWETIAFCEREKFAQRVLQKHWPSVPIIDDIHEFDGKKYRGVSLITGGFPCQPFSLAGKQRGADDDRALWPEMLRIITESRPRYVLAENVAGIIGMELDNVLSSLEAESYSVGAVVVPACAVDAKHRRDRVWILGADNLANTDRLRMERPRPKQQTTRCCGTGKTLANASNEGLQRRERSGATRKKKLPGGHAAECCKWATESDVGRVAHGIPERSHRLRGLGNAIVPQVAEEILRALIVSE